MAEQVTPLEKAKVKINWRSLRLTLCIGTLVLILPGNSHDIHLAVPGVQEQLPIQLLQEQLCQKAQAITVRVLSSELLGSGIIIHAQGDIYTILTNAHVLTGTDPPYQIQIPDGEIHPAEVVKTANFGGNDLGLLQFRAAGRSYSVAKLGASSTLAKGDDVFAAGFPFSLESSAPSVSSVSLPRQDKGGFAFRTGKIVLVLDKALEGGYKVGYSNYIEKGMSGGPLLNRAGELVGVNGMHAYPLWEAPNYYEDGSEPSPPLQHQITRYSWAIPIERVVHSTGG